MQEESVHDFHFVLTEEMKKKLTGLDLFEGAKGLSGRIVRILQTLIPVLEKEHKWGEQRMSRYMNVCDDPEEVREHVHVYVPGELYRRLKAMHQDLNAYSIAQLVRGFLEFFLGMVERYGDGVRWMLKRVFAHWKKEKNTTKLGLRKFLRQLVIIIQNLPGKNRLITIYDRNFSPFWILRV